MRRTLLVSTAAAALVAGTVFAAAQGAQKQAPAAGGATEHSAPSQGEVQRGSDHVQGQEQKGQEQSRPGERRGQAQGERRDQGQPKTTGQGQSKQQTQDRKGERQEGTQEERREGQGERREGQGERREGAKQEQSGKGSASFTTEQRTKIRETVLRGSNAPRVTKVDFSIKVGTVVPTSVHVVTVPDVIIEVHPEWRGHLYFVYNDEIIILDKDHNIIAIVEV